MADDKIVISAIARVQDLATGPLKAIAKAITGVSEVAAKTGNAVSQMGGKVGGALSGMSSRFGNAAGKIGNFARGVSGLVAPLGGLIGLAGLGGATAALTNFMDKAAEITSIAKRLGVTTAAVQTFANVFGDSTERAGSAMGELQRTLAKVQQGGKGAAKATDLLKKMGFTAQQIKLGDLNAMLPVIMESFKRTKDPIKRASMAMTLFKGSWQEVLPYLIKGKEAFAEAHEEMREFGFTDEDLERAAKGRAELKKLGNVVGVISGKIAAEILPAFTGIVRSIHKWLQANRELLKQVALPAFIGAIAASVVALGIAVTAALGPWGLLAGAIAAAGIAIYQNWDKIKAWFDKKLPGLRAAIEKTGKELYAWAKKATANIAKGFEEGGLGGGFAAMVTEFKNAWAGVGQWLADLFRKIDWGEVGTFSAQLMTDAMKALWQANLNVGQWIFDKVKEGLEWSRTKADWEGVGREGGRLLVLGIELSLKSLLSFTWLAAKIAEGLKDVKWGEVAKDVLTAFMALEIEFKSIGRKLIFGLIAGMWEAIPGTKLVGDAVAKLVARRPSAYDEGNAARAAAAAPPLPRSPMDLRSTDETQRLLDKLRPGQNKSEVTIENIVRLPDGGTVQTSSSSSGAPITVKNVGQSSTVMP